LLSRCHGIRRLTRHHLRGRNRDAGRAGCVDVRGHGEADQEVNELETCNRKEDRGAQGSHCKEAICDEDVVDREETREEDSDGERDDGEETIQLEEVIDRKQTENEQVTLPSSRGGR
jgi:hypothetical protein